MSLSPKERAERKASFQQMNLPGKVEYIYTYYRLPIFVGLVVLYFLVSTVYRQLTKKEDVLYTALINVSVGEELEAQLDRGFITSTGAEPKKSQVYLYSGLYLSNDATTENHQYAYASKLKLMAAIEAKQLDVVLMNQEAYDIYSQNGYLLEMSSLLSPGDPLYPLVEPHLTANTVVIEDNAVEYALRETHRYEAVTEEVVNGLDVSSSPLFQEAGFVDAVYLGVVANSPRIPAVLQYIAYLTGAQN